MGPPVFPDGGGWCEWAQRAQRQLNEQRQREHDEAATRFAEHCSTGDVINAEFEDITDQKRIEGPKP